MKKLLSICILFCIFGLLSCNYNVPVGLPTTLHFNKVAINDTIANCNVSFTFHQRKVIVNTPTKSTTINGNWVELQTFSTEHDYYLITKNTKTHKNDLCVYNKKTHISQFYSLQPEANKINSDMH